MSEYSNNPGVATGIVSAMLALAAPMLLMFNSLGWSAAVACVALSLAFTACVRGASRWYLVISILSILFCGGAVVVGFLWNVSQITC